MGLRFKKANKSCITFTKSLQAFLLIPLKVVTITAEAKNRGSSITPHRAYKQLEVRISTKRHKSRSAANKQLEVKINLRKSAFRRDSSQ
jgi:hypothetical protein